MPKPPLPPEKYKGKQAVVRMTEREYEALSNLAAKQSITISKLVREILREWAKAKKKQQSPDLPLFF
jgi:predicted HicB family RNase H-like nuclease